MTHLQTLLSADKRTVILEDLGHGTISIAVSDMINILGNTPPSYADLSATSQATAGWQKYFDDWKAKGLLS